MKIAIIGSGYVGLVTGTCFAELGNDVVCVDNDAGKVKTLREGKVPFYEPGLQELVTRNLKEGRLSFTDNIGEAVNFADVIFIAVGTPPRANGEADLSFVDNVARQIAEHMKSYKLVVEKSTVPVETGEKVSETIKRYNKHNIPFDVASNPEFLREGSAIEDFLRPDRVVIGLQSEKAEAILRKLYEPLNTKLIVTDIKSAEIIKHASNSFLASKISFINAVANICEAAGADIQQVAEGMGIDKRIGRQFLYPGVGYGGSCFPKDVDAFVRIAEKKGYDFGLLKEVQKVNKDQRKRFIKKIEDALWVTKGKTIAIWGLAFKPNTDDLREAPSIDIISALLKEGAVIRAYDPVAMDNMRQIFSEITYSKNPYEAAEGADAVVLLTEWNEFKQIDLKKIRNSLRYPLIIDGRNVYNPQDMEALGFHYVSVGRKEVKP
ncbi:MAG: UDP-glucose/GDP-mannose dehydrogenase family protein [Nanoarchaeota archaeon]|nr:MAG: UDP-glucose/GDP-mannose dehydrogenase family protein [Nanoarchaeota archaeon]